MFAHQVIEGIDEFVKSKSLASIDVTYFNFVNDFIRSSHKFHLGDHQVLLDMFGGLKDKELFFEFNEYLKFPYKVCWFDYVNNGEVEAGLVRVPKRGILVLQIGESSSHIQIFNFIKGIWIPSLVMFQLDTSRDKKFTVMPIETLKSKLSSSEIEILARDDTRDLATLNCVLLFMNCKNVERIKHEAPEALNKKRRSKGIEPVYDYHTLAIRSSKTDREYRGKLIPIEKNRLHWCRGHFKHFSEEHPLFGKYSGLWWWQPLLRGRDKEHFLDKEYAIKAKDAPRQELSIIR